MYPEYAIGIRAFRPLPGAAFGLPRCWRDCIHGAKVGAWEYRGGARIVHWEYIYP